MAGKKAYNFIKNADVQDAKAVAIITGISVVIILVVRRVLKQSAKDREEDQNEKNTEKLRSQYLPMGANPLFWRTFYDDIPKNTKVIRYKDDGKKEAENFMKLFGYWNEDEDSIINWFERQANQIQIAQVARYINQKLSKGEDEMIDILTSGKKYWFTNIGGGLSEKDLSRIYEIIIQKQKYR